MEKKTYELIGEFIITEDGKFFVSNKSLSDDDIDRLPIKILKQIIDDTKNKIIGI